MESIQEMESKDPTDESKMERIQEMESKATTNLKTLDFKFAN